jgi:exodeoxyribonuclease VII small subunit
MATKKNEAFDFGAKLKELETISSELEEQELDLDRGISQYEAGMKLVKELKEHL